MAIRPTAVVDSWAEIGVNFTVGLFAFTDSQTRIGDNCVIGPNTTIFRFTTLDADCRVHAGAVLRDLPQDRSFEDCESYVQIGANTVIREATTSSLDGTICYRTHGKIETLCVSVGLAYRG